MKLMKKYLRVTKHMVEHKYHVIKKINKLGPEGIN